MAQTINLKGRVFITFNIRALTGLHIGGSDVGIEIGGVDKTVIRDPLSNLPYIPGSSLKGKMRSLVEKYNGLKQNQRIGQGSIHSCGAEYRGDELNTKGKQEYEGCDVCQVFGLPGERLFSTPTRLVVRDVHLSKKSADDLYETGRTDLPYTEVKTEVAIDRVTSAANPRQMERVPAGVVFGRSLEPDSEGNPYDDQPAELVYTIYHGAGCDAGRDIDRLQTVVEGLKLLEDDYLGGLGSRGSGKVRLENISLAMLSKNGYLQPPVILLEGASLADLAAALPGIQRELKTSIAT